MNNTQAGETNIFAASAGGYMRIGEIAKHTGVTVRTLQYYDKEGLLTPSAQSEGGYRLYTQKDAVKLLHILMMKELGFSLSDIKKQQGSLDTPAHVVDMLTEHAAALRHKINTLTKSLDAVEALKAEVAQVETVDYMKYVAIYENLRMENEYYWMVKYFDNELLDTLASHMSQERAIAIMKNVSRLNREAIEAQKHGVSPESEEGQRIAHEMWSALVEVSKGDMSIIARINELVVKGHGDNNWDEAFLQASGFMQEAMDVYFANKHKENE